MRRLAVTFFILFSGILLPAAAGESEADQAARKTISEAVVLTDSEQQAALVAGLAKSPTQFAVDLLTRWKNSEFFIYSNPADEKFAVIPVGEANDEGKQAVTLLATGEPLKDEAGQPLLVVAEEDLAAAETDHTVRLAIKNVSDMLALTDHEPQKRLQAVEAIGRSQDIAQLATLESVQKIEKDRKVLRSLEEAIALINLAGEDQQKRIEACNKLGELESIPSQDALKALSRESAAAGQTEVAKAADAALEKIAAHLRFVKSCSTAFSGLSAGSVLLVVAIGLAITFGLMGVINMAHGEIMVVGAYTTYVVQCVFTTGLSISLFRLIDIRLPGMGLQGASADLYYIVALPLSFLTAAIVGLILERTVIRFLYKRPLESLLATWGVALILQQLFKLTFGSNNVQVSSPAWLAGSWSVNDVDLGYNRMFVIGFAFLILMITWWVLKKTPLGLLIRAVMQNRSMAACMGVRTERVNMLTFAFGSGLAGLAGAFLAQIGNVGPYLGKTHIVDSFMTVVVGGVGNLIGTVLSAFGIGMADNVLQHVTGNPVLGKIIVLGLIILFLQWRPAGLFVTRSRSLES